MKFTAEVIFAVRSDPAAIDGEAIAGMARAVEAAGYDAIGFNEHPIPSTKWLNAGGHDAYDPFVVHTWCAAVTQRIRLIPFLFILPYRNPFITAKSIASLDVLSGGRMVAAAGLGYLRSEFGALGIPFEERHARFDEAIACMKAAWAGEGVNHVGKYFQAHNQVATPFPTQKPHPPIWIGGNSSTVRKRVARYGQGWAPIPGGAGMAQTTRTVPMESLADIQAAMDDLHRLMEAQGRDPASIEVQMGAGPSLPRDASPDAHIEYLHKLEKMGVTQHIHGFQLGGSQKGRERMEQFAEQIVRAYA